MIVFMPYVHCVVLQVHRKKKFLQTGDIYI